MQEENTTPGDDAGASAGAVTADDAATSSRRRRAASRAAGPPEDALTPGDTGGETSVAPPDALDTEPETPTKRAPAKRTPAKKAATKRATAKKATTTKKTAGSKQPEAAAQGEAPAPDDVATPSESTQAESTQAEVPKAEPPKVEASQDQAPARSKSVDAAATATASEPDGAVAAPVLFQPPAFDATPLFAAPTPVPAGRAQNKHDSAVGASNRSDEFADTDASDDHDSGDIDDSDDTGDTDADGSRRRRRRRGGRGRRRKADGSGDVSTDDTSSTNDQPSLSSDESAEPDHDIDDSGAADGDGDAEGEGEGGSRRRRRRRRRRSESDTDETRADDPPNTVVKVRSAREVDDEVASVKGSTRLEAKKQRRREGREAGRRRPPILSEAEFLARREAVDRVMAVRQSGDLTQIAVLEDGVLVEHYVSRASQQSLIGNVYLGRVQNVLPAMEAAFIDIGRGRNAVLYAGEVDWAGLGTGDGQKRIEDVLKSGQSVLVQVTKDPIGHKGARLTSQVSLPGRYVVYVPGGSMNGISRKLPDNERNRLKKILKQVVPEDAGVIVRTAAEGASEEELTNDVARLQAEWEAIQKKSSGSAPALLHGEPDLAIKVVRDLFNEDFTKLVVSGDRVRDTIEEYVTHVASSLSDRVERWTRHEDVFAEFRINEQIAKAMDRKVWLPSGGSLVIDRTEAMTVVDVNTGKFTGSGGNLEETVTKNNLEAAEEIVRQLRLRDIGGIIVIDFIDMVLESNRDLVLRRLVECLGRDRTKHQVAEVTSLGLVQMTRKRIGTGLLEAFSEPCPHCKGRGVLVHDHPVESGSSESGNGHGNGNGNGSGKSNRSDKRGRKRKAEQTAKQQSPEIVVPKLEASASPGEASPADLMPASSDNGTSVQAEADEQAGQSEQQPEQAEQKPGQLEQQPEPAQPPARRRRRAQRPAGSPEAGSPEAENQGEGREFDQAVAESVS